MCRENSWLGVYLIYYLLWFSVEILINKCEVCNHVDFNYQQQILDQRTLPPCKCKMEIVSLNPHWIMRKVIVDCLRKIELIGSYPCDCASGR